MVEEREEYDDLVAPSIFTNPTPPRTQTNRGSRQGDEEFDDESASGAGRDRERDRASSVGSQTYYPHPQELPRSATASDVVKAWASRLNDVYNQCNDPEGDDYTDPQEHFKVSHTSKQVLLNRGHLKSSYNRDGSARMGMGDATENTWQAGKKLNKLVGRRRNQTGVDWKAELKRFYLGINMPEKIVGLDEILETWAGKEEQMLSSLMLKYKKIIPSALSEHLNTLHHLLETQTETSFVLKR